MGVYSFLFDVFFFFSAENARANEGNKQKGKDKFDTRLHVVGGGEKR